MNTLVLVMIGIALNLVPGDANQVTIRIQQAPIVVLQKQEDGTWAMKGTPLKLRADNTDLIIKGSKNKIDLCAMAGLAKDVKWKELKQIIVGNIPAQIMHLEKNGFDVIEKKKRGGKIVERRYEIRWEKAKLNK